MAEQKEDKSMKAGRVSQTVYRRSVLKQIQNNIEGIDFLRPSQEETCYIADESEERITIATDVSLAGNEKDLGVFAIAQAVDQLASRGARAYGISVRIMLPTFAYESRLKAMMVEISEICKEKGLRVFFADAQSVNGIQTSIVHVTAHGEAKKEQLLASRSAKAGEEIVLVKWIGMEGTLRIIREEGAALAERFAPGFLNKLEDMRDEIFSDRAMEIAGRNGVSAMHPIGEGGILAALWDMAEGAGIGLSVEMKKMTVRQETIEVCEVFHLNPYQLTSTGAVLMVTPKGEELKERLKREGIPAEIIGHTTEGNERIIWGGGKKISRQTGTGRTGTNLRNEGECKCLILYFLNRKSRQIPEISEGPVWRRIPDFI